MVLAGWCVMASVCAGGWSHVVPPRDSITLPAETIATPSAQPSDSTFRHMTHPSHPVSWDAGLELGQTSARAQGLDSLLYMATSSGLSTTLSGDVMLSAGRTQWVGQSGVSTAHDGYGAYGRIVGLVLSDGRLQARRGWMLSGDFTYVGANDVPSAMSGGVSMYYGRQDVVQAGLRLGERWRADRATPVLTGELLRTMTWTTHGMDAGLSVSVNGTRTAYTGSRVDVASSIPFNMPNVIRERTPVTLVDFGVQPRMTRGAWSVEVDAAARVGRAATLWDDAVTRLPNGQAALLTSPMLMASPLAIQRDQHDRMGAVFRATWQITPAFSIVGEGGHRMSDPISGVAGMRYVGVSLRFGLRRLRSAVDAYLDDLPHERSPRTPLIEHGVSVLPVDSTLVHPMGQNARRSDTPLRDVVVRGIPGERIEIAGDFTNWEPVVLRRCVVESLKTVRVARDNESIAPEAFAWCGRFTMAPGAHHVMIRVDGGDWHPPIGVPVVSDSFDGSVGLLVVL